MDHVEVYTFEDREGNPFGDFTTQSPDEARDYAREHGLRCIANVYTFDRTETVEDFTGTDDDDDQADDDEPTEPEEDDIITEDFRTFHRNGKLLIRLDDTQDWREVIGDIMDREGYWPNVWRVDDHGGAEIVRPEPRD